MKTLATLMVAVLGLLPAVAQAQVQNPDNGHWYETVDSASTVTWQQAKDAAELRSHNGDPGHLVTITSAAEQAFILNNFPIVKSKAHWIGAFQPPNSPEPSGGWAWVTGEPWDYTAWNSGEPNNVDTDNLPQDSIFFISSGLWNDVDGSSNYVPSYVVEYEPTESELLSFSLNASSVAGGVPVRATIVLTSLAPTGGAEVSLTNGNSAATVPATVTVPAGVKTFTFTIPTAPVSTVTQGGIFAVYNTGTDSDFLEVHPAGVKLVSLAPNIVIGGTPTRGLVMLEAPAVTDTIVTLTSSDTAVAKVPAQVKILAGQFYKSFNITTFPVAKNKSASISAAANGRSKSTPLTAYRQ